ncbi:transposase [Roseovarius tibetensis]|uniref:transposase n=1 Tax=Roseovarius tibetensis TaxID=2685897 RepID=UPI003D7FE55E
MKQLIETGPTDIASVFARAFELAMQIERGRRSVRAVMLAVAEMYVKGVSTRKVEAVMRDFGIESLSSSEVSRAAKLLDEELAAWRDSPLSEIKYLILDERYGKMRRGGIVREGEEDKKVTRGSFSVRPHVFFQRHADDGSGCTLIAWRQMPSICDGGRHDKRTSNNLRRDRCIEGQPHGCDGPGWGA